jgi:uncharacterized protein YndB with AHSA1/START domain
MNIYRSSDGGRATPAGSPGAARTGSGSGYPTGDPERARRYCADGGEKEQAVARIEETVHIAAAPERVWAVLTDWEGQSRWMRDARSVTVLTPGREGVGVIIRAETDIAGLVVSDDMETTEWVDGERIGVRHLGRLIRGVGAFELEPEGDGTRFIWWEEVEAPFGALGETVAEAVVVPWVSRVFRGSLADLKRVCEAPA